jgi:regulator of RNase E activity RraA
MGLSSCNVADALRAKGKAFQSMDAGIRPVHVTMRAVGPAFTVRCYPGATWAVEQALEQASPGDVLVVDGGGVSDTILMGGLMSLRASARGMGGAILDAAVRDVDQIIATGLPVFARHISPRAGTFAQIGECQTTICCGRIPVQPNDWIVADQSGIAIVPADMIDVIFAEATQILQREQTMEEQLRLGKTLADAAEVAFGSKSAPRRDLRTVATDS